LLFLLVGVLVVAVAGAATWWFVFRNTPVSTPTVTIERQPLPTPTIPAVPRPADTAFTRALPTSVLQYAVVSSAAEPSWTDLGALEAYVEELSDGGDGTLVLRAGQWATPEEVGVAFAQITQPPAETDPTATSTGTGGTPRTGKVQVGGVEVGHFVILDAGDGNGSITWSNNTSIFQLTGTAAEAVRAYKAFPM
jgi:hypothetical protein